MPHVLAETGVRSGLNTPPPLPPLHVVPPVTLTPDTTELHAPRLLEADYFGSALACSIHQLPHTLPEGLQGAYGGYLGGREKVKRGKRGGAGAVERKGRVG